MNHEYRKIIWEPSISLPFKMSMTHWFTKWVIFNSFELSLRRRTKTFDASINVPKNCSNVFTWNVGWINRRCKFHSSAVQWNEVRRKTVKNRINYLWLLRWMTINIDERNVYFACFSDKRCVVHFIYVGSIKQWFFIENMFALRVFNEIWPHFHDPTTELQST